MPSHPPAPRSANRTGVHAESVMMFCQKCGYNLQGLPEHRCPECGQPFDPADPATYRRVAGHPRNPLVLLLVYLVPLGLCAGYWSLFFPFPGRSLGWHDRVACLALTALGPLGPLATALVWRKGVFLWLACAVLLWAAWLLMVTHWRPRRWSYRVHVTLVLIWLALGGAYVVCLCRLG